MADLEILHLSDLHWSTKDQHDRQIVINALTKDLRTLISDGAIHPDLVIFSGDLAQSGDDETLFEGALTAFIDPVLSAVGLSRAEMFIAPGNHDISREEARKLPYIEIGLKETLKTVEQANKHIDLLSEKDTSTISIDRSKEFYKFVDKEFPANSVIQPLVRCHERSFGDLKIGIACFDTAWRATGEADDVDRNNLLIGERNVDHAIAGLEGTDIRLAVMHHPLEWLADFDEVAVSSRLSEHFDVIFCGHTHRALPSTRTTAQGSAIFSQAGTCYASRKWFNGYQCVKLSIAAGECEFIIRGYVDVPRREFDVATTVAKGGSVTLPYVHREANTSTFIVEGFLREKRSLIRAHAVDHINMIGGSEMASDDIREGFVEPPLSRRSASETGNPHGKLEELSADDILREDRNSLIVGPREHGKSSLLHYFAVLTAEGVFDRPRIPVIVSGRTLKPNDYNLKKAINAYFGAVPKGFSIDEAPARGDFLFLVDDVGDRTAALTAIKEHLEAHPKDRWICSANPRAGSVTGQVDEAEELAGFQEITVGMLPRRSIRTLSKRWSPAIGQDDDEIFDAVMKQIRRDGLPRTGYIVTLLLWAMQQEKELGRVNEAVLLSNVVDFLLGKADFTQSVVGNFDPRAKEITLEHLAEYLKGHDGSANINDVTVFFAELFGSKRLPFAAGDTLNELVKCGILDRSDDIISFKYPCFGEYFFASRLRSDANALAEATTSKKYLDNAREIELLAGLRRQNEDLLRSISDDITHRLPHDIASITRARFDEISDVSLGISITRKQLDDLKKRRMSTTQIDDLMDAAERRAARREIEPDDTEGKNSEAGETDLLGEPVHQDDATSQVVTRMNPGEFIAANDLLARIVRNSDFTDFDVKGPATRLVLSNAAKVTVLIRAEFLSILDEVILKSDEQILINEVEKPAFIYVVSKLLATLSALSLSDQLSSPNVIPMMEEILEEGEVSTIERIFACFMLQACRAPRWHEHFSALLNEQGMNGFVVECIVERIQAIVGTQYLPDKENDKLHSVIDTAAAVLKWSSAQKGQVFSNLKKAALQADLRDTRA